MKYIHSNSGGTRVTLKTEERASPPPLFFVCVYKCCTGKSEGGHDKHLRLPNELRDSSSKNSLLPLGGYPPRPNPDAGKNQPAVKMVAAGPVFLALWHSPAPFLSNTVSNDAIDSRRRQEDSCRDSPLINLSMSQPRFPAPPLDLRLTHHS